ncbi:MAG: hypothetical protein CL470_00675 [Acidimicrobiaceae bacterium]|nr:hypothetical protein [Acidimicrobiaceae bacterium]|tara:strand:- start:2002 stop:2595 length:594 start_codon:yes stop_codon:yes gene_type:complete
MPPSKKSSSSKKSKKVEPKKVEPEPVKVETPVVDAPVEPPTEASDNYDSEFTDIQEQLKAALTIIKSLSSQVSKLEKRVQRDRKVMDKKMKGRVKRVVDPNKPPSGFAKPGPISEELRKFLSLDKGELIARTEVTKRITAYCKQHDLQKEEDKRTIHADATLRKLLRMKKGDELTFFNLQKYMKVHYPNKDGVFVHN